MNYGLLDSGIRTGTDDYVRYVIISRQRSGSNLLYNALKSHPQIICFNELFGWKKQVLFNYPGYRWWAGDPEVVRMRDEAVDEFMDRYVYRSHPPKTGAVGFKLFYDQHRKPKRSAWDWLADHPEVRIIHLQRRNALKAYVSRELARQTKTWVGVVEGIENMRVHVDTDKLMAYIRELDQWNEALPQYYPDHEIKHIYFEDMLKDFESYSRNICSNLNVPYAPLHIGTPKQGRYELTDIVTNWKEVEAVLVKEGLSRLLP